MRSQSGDYDYARRAAAARGPALIGRPTHTGYGPSHPPLRFIMTYPLQEQRSVVNPWMPSAC